MTAPAIETDPSPPKLDPSHYNLRYCTQCQHIYSARTNNPFTICKDCQRANELRDRQEYNTRRRRSSTQGPRKLWTLNSDPTGEWSVGAEFETTDFIISLQSQVWPIGATFDHEGQIYTIQPESRVKAGDVTYHAHDIRLVREM